MPSPPSDRRLTRRTAAGIGLSGAGALLAGCTPKGIDRRPKPGAAARRSAQVRAGVDPDVALAAAVLADEQALLDRVVATVERHPRLGPMLASARSAHQAHVDLLQEAVPDDARVAASDASSPGVSSSVSPSVSPSPTKVPVRAAVALRAVAAAEDRLALVGRRSSFAAESGAFARVLGSMAAAAAQQATIVAAAAVGR